MLSISGRHLIGTYVTGGFAGDSVVESSCQAADVGLIPGWGRSLGEGNGNPLQYSCLGKPMDREEEPGKLQSMMLQRVGYNLATTGQQM